ncbi:hypothetical protein [Moorella stamsii (nom. illeg.)]|uniref:hypothetical protein n=1 Tax=Neomoorella stamsii TaxID=1266720 RepID=UPI0006D53A4C|nr:hypothetical protein [Moorella stamsii]
MAAAVVLGGAGARVLRINRDGRDYISGRTGGLIPLEHATGAEAIVMLERLMEKGFTPGL